MLTIYTAVFGPYDFVKSLKVPQRGNHRYILYTDQEPDSPIWKYYDKLPQDQKIWEVRKVPLEHENVARQARWYKIMFHKHIDDEFSMWVDGTFYINCDLSMWWRRRFRAPMTCITHPFDDCVYTDIVSCIRGKRGDPEKLMDQREYYKSIGLPKHNGLISSGILMRQNVPRVTALCEEWWGQVEKFSVRDQIGFGYAAWKHPDVVNYTRWNYTTQREFEHVPHRHKMWDEKFMK